MLLSSQFFMFQDSEAFYPPRPPGLHRVAMATAALTECCLRGLALITGRVHEP